MTFEIGKYQLKLLNESDFQIGSKSNNIEYRKRYFTESDFILATKFGIQILENGLEYQNAIIGAEGGASGLHETSQLIDNERILICCGDTVFCLAIPDLNLIWNGNEKFPCLRTTLSRTVLRNFEKELCLNEKICSLISYLNKKRNGLVSN